MEKVKSMQLENLLEQYYFEKYVLDMCIMTLERGGATSKLDTYQFLSSVEAWGIPKYPDKTVVLPCSANLVLEITNFIHANEAHLREVDCWLGTWINPYTDTCYLDITTIYPCLEEARREAIALSERTHRRIVAIYDFKQEQPLYL